MNFKDRMMLIKDYPIYFVLSMCGFL